MKTIKEILGYDSERKCRKCLFYHKCLKIALRKGYRRFGDD